MSVLSFELVFQYEKDREIENVKEAEQIRTLA